MAPSHPHLEKSKAERKKEKKLRHHEREGRKLPQEVWEARMKSEKEAAAAKHSKILQDAQQK